MTAMDGAMVKGSTEAAIASGVLDVNDECAQCGRGLRDFQSFWATEAGNYCRVRCAEAHAADLELFEAQAAAVKVRHDAELGGCPVCARS